MLSSNDFSVDPEEAFATLRATSISLGYRRLAQEIERLGPLTISPTLHPSVAAHLYSAVVGQQLSLKAAATIRGRVQHRAEVLGVPVTDLYAPEHEATLRACGVSGRKARSLQAIRAAEASGILSGDLAGMPHSQRVERLCGIWGVGKWTADMIGIFHFLDDDIWPEGDVTAVGMFRLHTGSDDTIEETMPFAPFRSHLARYMWLSRDSSAVAPAGGVV